MYLFFFFFFFSSRRRHTSFSRDWSSDVCSSDLVVGDRHRGRDLGTLGHVGNELGEAAAAYRRNHGVGHPYVAGERNEPRDGPEQGGLPGPVGPDWCEPSPGSDADGEPPQDRDAVVGHGQVGNLDTHESLRVRRSTRRKKGAPTKAVMTPMGISAGERAVLAMRSARIRKAAPKMTERGRIRR